jgi:hypothetical protein
MPRLQQVKRANGSIVSSVNLPIEDILRLGWAKGDNLVVSNKEPKRLIIFKEEDTLEIETDG